MRVFAIEPSFYAEDANIGASPGIFVTIQSIDEAHPAEPFGTALPAVQGTALEAMHEQ